MAPYIFMERNGIHIIDLYKTMAKIDEAASVGHAMDVMIRWFCLLFGNQFSPDDVLDGYPVDRLMHDIALALMAVQAQTTEILSDFRKRAS